MDSSGPEYGPLVSCSGSIMSWNFFDKLRDWRVLKEDYAPWSCLGSSHHTLYLSINIFKVIKLGTL
jgi:hypothetical protein